MLREFAESWFRSITFKRRIPDHLGRGQMVVSTGVGGLKFIKPTGLENLDPFLVRSAAILVKSGDVVWDVGANLGLFSVVASARSGPSGQVIAFEPDAFASRCLQSTICLLDSTVHSNIEVLTCAVAASPAIFTFVLAHRSSASNYIEGFGSTQAGGVDQRISVMGVSLDWMLSQRKPPNVLKIDAEGAELEVIKGASVLLSEVRPLIHIEVGAANKDSLSRIFHSQEYALFDAEGDGTISCPLDCCAWNTLAIPIERVEEIAAKQGR